MKPVNFEGSNVVFAKDQPEYLQLPAHRFEDGQVVTEWEFSDEERKRIANGENLRITIMTFNNPLQPIRPYLSSMLAEDEEQDKGKKSNAFSDRKCGSTDEEYDISKEE